MNTYPDCYYVLSSRPDAVARDWLGKMSIAHAEVLPLSPDDRSTFIDCWHRAVGQRYRAAGKPDVTEVAGPKLKEQLRDNPTVARLTTNPLLAAAICALHLDGKAQLPRNEGEVCNKLCELLLDLRDKHQHLIPKDDMHWTGYERLDYDPHKKAILSDIACAMIEEGRSSLPAAEVDKHIAGIVTQYESLKGVEATAIRKALIERSGLLRLGAKEEIEFIHNTFKEFLAAERWVALGKRKVVALARHAADPAWQPVIRFAALRARPGTGIADRLVEKLLSKFPERKLLLLRAPPGRRGVHLLVVQIAAAAALSPDLQERIATLRGEFLPPASDAEARVIASCGESAIPHLLASRHSDPNVRRACITALGLIGGKEADLALDQYLPDRDVTVLASLADYRNVFTFPAVREKLLGSGKPPDWCNFYREPHDLGPLRGLVQLRAITLHAVNLLHSEAVDLEPLSALTQLQLLGLPFSKVRDLGPLRELSQLRSLDISDTEVSNLEPLSGLPQLEFLNISSTQVSDLGPLRGLAHLTQLYFYNTAVSELGTLRGLTQLQCLGISNIKICDLGPLSGLSQIRFLHIPGVQLIDLGPLSQLSQLQDLRISSTEVSDLCPLGGLSQLQKLDISSTEVSDLCPLSGLSHLQSLDLSETPVADLGPLAGLSQLWYLHISGTEVSDLGPLSGLPALRYIWLGSFLGEGMPRLSKKAIAAFHAARRAKGLPETTVK